MTTTAAGLLQVPAPFAVDPLALHLRNPAAYPFLLQSTASGTPQGRFDVLFAAPGERLVLGDHGRLAGGPAHMEGFLAALDMLWSDQRLDWPLPGPFAGGWFLLLGYELAAEVEPSLRLVTSGGLPVAVAVRVPVALVRDRQTARAWITAEPGHEAAVNALVRDLDCAGTPSGPAGALLAGPVAEPMPGDFLAAVAAAKDYIRAGDIFQANLSREWRARVVPGVMAGHIYARLRQTNPGPFAGLAVVDDLAVISSSPERLVSRRDERVQTRPIAGTHPRGGDRSADAPTREALLHHPKERAEHVMLIDLERNDLGRVCAAGTVRVDEFMTLESYAHVHHIVSNVSGRLRDDVSPGALIRAVFPGGTITGCPKVRCMAIIAELENRRRGFYTGAMGYLGRDGSLDLNILIRTMVMQSGQLSLAAGGGIVADSEPERELEETRAKAKGMLLALQQSD
jgi:anthranilate synthase component 1